jgi:hypothetical protein
MLTITYSETAGFGVADAPPYSTDLQLDGLALSKLAEEKLREALGVSGLTDEQAEVARLEAELDAAVADGRIADWWPYTRDNGYTVIDECSYVWNSGCLYPRLDQARRAAEKVRTLPVPKPALPDVEEMSGNECRRELAELTPNEPGWTSGTLVPVMWVGSDCYTMDDGETLTEFDRRLLTAARALYAEGEAKP